MTDTPDAPLADAPSSDTPPDRVSTNPRSDWFDADVLARGIGIRLNGVEKTTVDEYCVSEGWVRVTAGRSRDRHGNPMTLKLAGTVEPYFRDTAAPSDAAPSEAAPAAPEPEASEGTD